MNTCNHVGPVKALCSKPIGHRGLHMHIEEVGQCNFKFYRWDDAGDQFDGVASGPEFHVNYHSSDRETVVGLCIEDAQKTLPPGVVFEVRCKRRPVEGMLWDFGRRVPTLEEQADSWGVAWYWTPSPQDAPAGFEHECIRQEPLFSHATEQAEVMISGGYELIARLKTPM